MGRGRDDEGNARRKERKVRKEVATASRRRRKDIAPTLAEVAISIGIDGVLYYK